MKIGIDIDGVVLDYEKGWLASVEIFDIEKCAGKGKVFLDQYIAQEKYAWTEEEKKQCVMENFARISQEAPIMGGAKYVLDKLKEMGHELIIISARGTEADEMIDIVKEKLAEEKITFDKYYWKEKNKLKVCQNEKIDLMIDDRPETCEKLAQNKIRTLYFRGIRGWDLPENEYLKEVSNWGEVYRYIKGANK